MLYFKPENILHVYAWNGDTYQTKNLDITADRSYLLFTDLFFYPFVNGGVSIIRTHDRRFIPQCAGYAMHEALGCVEYFCNQSGGIPSKFEIMLSNGEVFAPPAIYTESIILTPIPKIIPASNLPINIYDYSIYFSNVEIIDVGTNPLGLASNLALSIVFTEANGDEQKLREFSQLPVWFTDETGNTIKNVILQTLEPQNGTIYFRWILYITNPSKAYYLHARFPTGEEIVDFSPLIP